MRYENRRWRGGPPRFLFFPFGILFALLLGWVVKWLWNAILPELIGVGYLTYWKAVGLLVLSRLLFGGWGGGARRKRWRRHHEERRQWRGGAWRHLSDEERERLREEWRERCRQRWR